MFLSKIFRKLVLVFLFSPVCVLATDVLPTNNSIINLTKNYSVASDSTTKHIFLGNQVIATIDGIGKEATIYYIYPDHLGDSNIILDKNSKIDEVIDYYAFGQKRFDKQLGPYNEKRKYLGQEYDDLSNLQYLNARYYDPALGRFISQDPDFWRLNEDYLIDPQQQNSYSYSRNNPIAYSDPFGLSSAIYNAMPKGGWRFGQQMGEFNGVVAYYNGVGSASTTYSCVEYAKRYQSQIYGIKNIGPVGDAKTMWTMLATINNRLTNTQSSYAFTKHNNGDGFNLPTEGDLMFWTEGRYGHVMVVTEAKFDINTNKGYVEIIDQNASQKAVRSFDVKKTTKGYLVMRNETTPMAGWFSPTPVDKNIIKPTKTPQIIEATTNKQSSVAKFFNRVWQFFKR